MNPKRKILLRHSMYLLFSRWIKYNSFGKNEKELYIFSETELEGGVGSFLYYLKIWSILTYLSFKHLCLKMYWNFFVFSQFTWYNVSYKMRCLYVYMFCSVIRLTLKFLCFCCQNVMCPFLRMCSVQFVSSLPYQVFLKL